MKPLITVALFGIALLFPSISSAAACCAAPVAAPTNTLPADSVYQLDAVWTNAAGRAVALTELRGPQRIVAMFYASCTYACPMLVADLKKIAARLPPGSDVVFTLFSFDPERDSPANLSAFAERQGIAGSKWVLMTSGPEQVRELAAVLGVRYRKDTDGSIAHSNPITLLDGDGRIGVQLPGLNEDPTALLEALTATP